LLGRKVFTTIENNMCDLEKESMLNSFGGRKNLINHFKYIPNIFGITKHIIDNTNCGVKLEDKVLYLGVEIDLYIVKPRKILKNIVFLGSLKRRKRVYEFLQLAEKFPAIIFYIIGDGIDSKLLKIRATKNVIFLGQLNQQEVASIFNKMDLLFLPSKSEGFPKVILEAAASGIPSIVYSDYGASEWIEDGENGFVINNFEDSIAIIERLIDNKTLLIKSSKGAALLAKRFDWKLVVKGWEMVICNLK
jgi:glycosyltransferase involved in cell wall biosynthesis